MARTRRGRGEGSIYYVERRGEWAGVISLGFDLATGKRRRVVVYAPSKKQVQQRLSDARIGTVDEVARRRGPMLRDFATDWLTNEVVPNLRATTSRSYTGILNAHVLPVLGLIRVNKLTPADVSRCLNLIRERCSASMAGKARFVLSKVMAKAVALEIAARNPVDGVKAPKHDAPAPAFLTAEQLQALFTAVRGDRFEALVVLLGLGGLRLGEALALRWDDLDAKTRTLAVTKTAQEAGGPIKLVPPKTRTGRRTIALGSATVAALRRRRKVAEGEGFAKESDLIFPSTAGSIVRQSNLHRRWWQPLLDSAGLPRIRIHDLRHSSASLSLLAGTSARVVSDRLGHSDPGFTMRTYTHVVDTLHREDAGAVENLVKRAGRARKRKS